MLLVINTILVYKQRRLGIMCSSFVLSQRSWYGRGGDVRGARGADGVASQAHCHRRRGAASAGRRVPALLVERGSRRRRRGRRRQHRAARATPPALPRRRPRLQPPRRGRQRSFRAE